MSNITLIGAGNLATHIGLSLSKAGHSIIQVYSRTSHSASQLANRLSCPFTTELDEIIESDLAIIAVNDDAIEVVEKHIHFTKVHTSGSTKMNILNGEHIGVLYPLQSFTKQNQVDFKTIPICIEANSQLLMALLKEIASSISNKIIMMNSDQRTHLHLSAVLACNFSNLMYQLSDEICRKHNLSFELLYPLIEKTANKISSVTPKDAQTGPAKRQDYKIINQHLEMLKNSNQSEIAEIYKQLSESIEKRV
ncbi:MAG: Rossmann-like and DUF2520 domain-containing protein [Flavobacteriales bacterium]